MILYSRSVCTLVQRSEGRVFRRAINRLRAAWSIRIAKNE
jgi:hypothetical protein